MKMKSELITKESKKIGVRGNIIPRKIACRSDQVALSNKTGNLVICSIIAVVYLCISITLNTCYLPSYLCTLILVTKCDQFATNIRLISVSLRKANIH